MPPYGNLNPCRNKEKRPGGANTEQEYKKLCLTFASRTEKRSPGELQVCCLPVRVQLPQFLELGSPLVDVLAGAAAQPRGAEGAEGAEAAGAGAAALGAEDAQRVLRRARGALGLPQQRRQPPERRVGRAALHGHLQLGHVVGVLQGEIGHRELALSVGPTGSCSAGNKEGMIASLSAVSTWRAGCSASCSAPEKACEEPLCTLRCCTQGQNQV